MQRESGDKEVSQMAGSEAMRTPRSLVPVRKETDPTRESPQ